ncbi:hypothetical protein SBOR_9050 [Sclerotinia borealis F-4128]|uniref:Uncharacterized protein n=1 Tax=Sclerotinia borealis (strain F-4128) TaxID=1432307 RepID=W9C3V4_SCLBF|nr:hypothetical protein SBOR_9050 [Sclerotinia borealis F-4128]
MTVSSHTLYVSSLSAFCILLLAKRGNADFTTTKWNPVRGNKFTIAWSGTSDAGSKNLTLNDADSSGNEFALVQNIATGINGGSFRWLPSTSIPDGTYVINLHETPNKVDAKGLKFIGKAFVFGNAKANQPVVVSSPTTTSGAAQVVQTTKPTTTSGKQEITVLAPTTIVIISTPSYSATVETVDEPLTISTSALVESTSTSNLESSSTTVLSSIPSIFTTILTSTYLSTSASQSHLTTSASSPPPTSPTSYPSPPSSPSSSSPSPSPSPSSSPLHPSLKTALLLTTTCLLLLTIISTYTVHRYLQLKTETLLGNKINHGNQWYRYTYKWKSRNKNGNRGHEKKGENEKKVKVTKVMKDPIFYDGQKKGWVLRVNSVPVELGVEGKDKDEGEGEGKMWV